MFYALDLSGTELGSTGQNDLTVWLDDYPLKSRDIVFTYICQEVCFKVSLFMYRKHFALDNNVLMDLCR